MRHTALSVALLAALAVASPQAGGGGDDKANEARVYALCHPPLGNSTGSSGPRPPCHVIDDLGYLCKANGSSPLALDAHAQCMCNGSFFADYLSCQSCQRVHGGLSPADTDHYSAVISSVSRVLCAAGATPTAEYPKIFESVAAAMPPATTTGGNTVKSDSGGGRTEVAVYATITYSQGPGRVEGSATAATAARSSSSSSRTRANDGVGGAANTSPGTATSATTSTPNGAVPTAGLGGVVFGLAAGAIAAAL